MCDMLQLTVFPFKRLCQEGTLLSWMGSCYCVQMGYHWGRFLVKRWLHPLFLTGASWSHGVFCHARIHEKAPQHLCPLSLGLWTNTHLFIMDHAACGPVTAAQCDMRQACPGWAPGTEKAHTRFKKIKKKASLIATHTVQNMWKPHLSSIPGSHIVERENWHPCTVIWLPSVCPVGWVVTFPNTKQINKY